MLLWSVTVTCFELNKITTSLLTFSIYFPFKKTIILNGLLFDGYSFLITRQHVAERGELHLQIKHDDSHSSTRLYLRQKWTGSQLCVSSDDAGQIYRNIHTIMVIFWGENVTFGNHQCKILEFTLKITFLQANNYFTFGTQFPRVPPNLQPWI